MMTSIKRFTVGAIIGSVIAATYWGTTIYFDYPLTLTRGILGCLILGIICGLITLKWGYQVVEALLENLR
jgi:ABC-type uncharacterized transport system permease subunit